MQDSGGWRFANGLLLALYLSVVCYSAGSLVRTWGRSDVDAFEVKRKELGQKFAERGAVRHAEGREPSIRELSDIVDADPDFKRLKKANDSHSFSRGIGWLLRGLVWPVPLIPFGALLVGAVMDRATIARWTLRALLVLTTSDQPRRQRGDELRGAVLDASPRQYGIRYAPPGTMPSPEELASPQQFKDTPIDVKGYLAERNDEVLELGARHPWLSATSVALQFATGALAFDAIPAYLTEVLRHNNERQRYIAESNGAPFVAVPDEDANVAADKIHELLLPLIRGEYELPPEEDAMDDAPEHETNIQQQGAHIAEELGLPQEFMDDLMLNAEQGVSLSTWWGHQQRMYQLDRNQKAMEQLSGFYRSVAGVYQSRMDAEATVRKFRGEDRDREAEARARTLQDLEHKEQVLQRQANIEHLKRKVAGPQKLDPRERDAQYAEELLQREDSFAALQAKMIERKRARFLKIDASDSTPEEKASEKAAYEEFHADALRAAAKDFADRGDE